MNAKWHRAHPMPRYAGNDERISRHLEHASTCACREIPPSLLAEIQRRGLKAPTHSA
jgi:hypothetical protein